MFSVDAFLSNFFEILKQVSGDVEYEVGVGRGGVDGGVVGLAGLDGGFSACQGDSSDLSQLLLPDEGRTAPDATCLSQLMKFCQCGGREREGGRGGSR